jgi:septal ring factor EnvC (AmiA/AmiB activator)
MKGTRVLRLRWASVICLLIAALCVASAAQASDSSVRSAIESSGKASNESPELQAALTEIKSDPKSIAKLQNGLKEFETALRKVANTVSAQEASTENGKKGEADWLAGVHKVIRGFEGVGTAVNDVKDHHKAAAKTELKQAAEMIKSGVAEAKTGKALLGVK